MLNITSLCRCRAKNDGNVVVCWDRMAFLFSCHGPLDLGKRPVAAWGAHPVNTELDAYNASIPKYF